jgi:hypothetical protein
MSDQKPQRLIRGDCPSCGPSSIRVVLEGASYFIGLSTPNWSCCDWNGECQKCHACLESHFEEDPEAEALDWTLVDEEKVEFLLGHSPPAQTDRQNHPLWDSELDG